MSDLAVMPLSDYVNSCEKIRGKTQNTDSIKSGDMPSKIDEVYEAGAKSEYDRLWDALQNYGTRNNYAYAFCNWNCEYVRPKYKVVPTNRESLNMTFTSNSSLKKVEAKYFDFTGKDVSGTGTYAPNWTFGVCPKLEEIEDLGIQAPTTYPSTFNYSQKLHTIAILRVNENTAFSNTFSSCYALENIKIEGCIGQNGFNVQWSTKLSKESIQSIISALSTTASGKTVTLSKTAVNTAFSMTGDNPSEEWSNLIKTKANWTISLA